MDSAAIGDDPFSAFNNPRKPRGASSNGAADDGKGPSQRDKLLSVADRGTFWRCPDGLAYVSVPVNGHIEHHRVRSQRFRDWLLVEAGREFPIEVAGKTRPGTFGKNAVEDALAGCEAMAAAGETVQPAPLRVAAHDDRVYLDLGDQSWRAVEIAPSGWRVVDQSPVPVLRTRRTRALPYPAAGGSLHHLRKLLPLHDEDQWRLTVLWLLAALRPSGPYPILALSGEQGTGKSFAARALRCLVDPSGDNIMQPPREDRDLIAAARGNHVLAFDNISSISTELADSLCRLATGGDIGGRLLYTNDDTAAFSAHRPIIINGIPDLISRGDLVSRSLFIRLSPMVKRRTEAELWADFDKAAPVILGALLDVMSAALARLPDTVLPSESAAELRMADFALLAIAAEPGLGWPRGTAVSALKGNAAGSSTMMAELDAVAIAVRGLVERKGEFKGLVAELHGRLNEAVDLDTRRAPGWPKHHARLGEHLRRIAPALRAAGIDVRDRHTNRGTLIEIGVTKAAAGDGGDGEATSLSGFYGGREKEHQAGGVNSSGFSPSPQSPNPDNGGNPRVSGTARGDSGDSATVTSKPQAEPSESRQSDGGDSEIPTEFIRAKRRVVL
jgi:hypothetical protein